MTGYDIYKKATVRLGYSGNIANNRTSSSLENRSLELINQISEDLKFTAIERLSDKIEVDGSFAEAIICGLAMLLAISEGDGEKTEFYTSLYKSKRQSLLSKTDFVEDKLPTAF